MKAQDLRAWFDGRCAELEQYLVLLESLQKWVTLPKANRDATIAVSADQLKILYSATYLQLYNLVEATITGCLEALSDAICEDGIEASALSHPVFSEWVRYLARTHVDQAADRRLDYALEMATVLSHSLPVSHIKFERGGGGNWDDREIEKFLRMRLELTLPFSPDVRQKVKRAYRNDDRGVLSVIKAHRNSLAHGNVSFVECADQVVVSDLRECATVTQEYLSELLNGFVKYILSSEFLLHEYRYASQAGSQ